jgi:proteasome lid subunit RPN8/RPN11
MQLDGERLPLLVREKSFYRIDRRVRYDRPVLFRDLAKDIGLHRMAEEYVYCICVDTKMRVIGLFEVTHGTVNVSFASPREIFQKALMLGAVHIILMHNHPSGDPTPSGLDIEVTNRVKNAGDIIGISLLDHVIIGDDSYLVGRSQIFHMSLNKNVREHEFFHIPAKTDGDSVLCISYHLSFSV